MIPECRVEFFPKVTAYDGRLFMNIHSIHSLLNKIPGMASAATGPSSPLTGPGGGQKRLLNGSAKPNSNTANHHQTSSLIPEFPASHSMNMNFNAMANTSQVSTLPQTISLVRW